MKLLQLLFFSFFCSFSAQKNLAFDSLILKDVRNLLSDDYGNIYLYKNKDFSFTKYDSLGIQKGKLMLTLPFKIQSVQNPLNIPSFSENAQELKFFDQNLNEIQSVNFRQKFGFIRNVYAEDLQQIWLLDESMKRLVQYNFREDQMVNSFPFNINFEELTDFLVFESKAYFLGRNWFSVYNFKAEKIFETPIEDGRKLRRENQNILIMGKNTVQKWDQLTLKTVFSSMDAQIVDKNSAAYFVIKDNKLYLYHP